MTTRGLLVLMLLGISGGSIPAVEPDRRFPIFGYLTGTPSPSMIAYVPSELDPRQEVNNRRLATSSIKADLSAMRPAFDGLILYGYHESTTPRIVALAKELKYRAVILGVWDPKSSAELDGVATLARLFEHDLAIGVLIGNEGVTFKRYEAEDLPIALARVRASVPKTVAISMSEPLFQYQKPYARDFGDFLAPNIHPVFDKKDLPPAVAAKWTRDEAEKLARLARKPVLVKETGMPHAGSREGVRFTPEMQASYWSEYLKPGKLTSIDDTTWIFSGVAFEAFDMPWKAAESRLEIEASWGIMGPKRQPYPAFDVWKKSAGA